MSDSSSAFVRKVAKYNRRAGDFKRALFGSKGVKGAVTSVNDLAKEVMMLKNTLKLKLNSETKRTRGSSGARILGQVEVNSTGHMCFALNPTIAQGVTESTRNGNSIKMQKLRLHLQIRGQQNTMSGRKIRFHFIRAKTSTGVITANSVVNSVYDLNPLTGLYDFHAPRAYRSSKNDGLSIVKSKVMYLPKASTDAGTAGGLNQEERPIGNYILNIPLKDIFRYENDSDNVATGLEYFILMTMDTGNCGATSSSVANISNPTQYTGAEVLFAYDWHYVDN